MNFRYINSNSGFCKPFMLYSADLPDKETLLLEYMSDNIDPSYEGYTEYPITGSEYENIFTYIKWGLYYNNGRDLCGIANLFTLYELKFKDDYYHKNGAITLSNKALSKLVSVTSNVNECNELIENYRDQIVYVLNCVDRLSNDMLHACITNGIKLKYRKGIKLIHEEDMLLVYEGIPDDKLFKRKGNIKNNKLFWSYKQYDQQKIYDYYQSIKENMNLDDKKYLFKYQKINSIDVFLAEWSLIRSIITYSPMVNEDTVVKNWKKLENDPIMKRRIYRKKMFSIKNLNQLISDPQEKPYYPYIAMFQKIDINFIKKHRAKLKNGYLAKNKYLTLNFDTILGMGLPMRMEDELMAMLRGKKRYFIDMKIVFN